MKKQWIGWLLVISLALPFGTSAQARTLPVARWRSQMQAAWLGKMVGVSVGIQREFHFLGRLGQPHEVPKWYESLLDMAFIEDDLYLPFALLETLDSQGKDVTPREMAIALYPYSFEFWNGHYANFERGIAPPAAGHPVYAPFPDALSYAFAADYSGLIAPGQVDVPVEMAQRFGPMLVYGDGVYGGAFVGALYSEAFFSQDPVVWVETGLSAIPADSWLHESVNLALSCYRQDPTDFTKAWQAVTDRYFWDADYNWIQWPYGGRTAGIDLDVKLNAAYIAIALLYGQGDIQSTLEIAVRCGQDCDCNAANALGVLFCSLGMEGIPQTYGARLGRGQVFAYIGKGYEALCQVTESVARQVTPVALIDGEEVFCIEPSAPLAWGHTLNSKWPQPLEPATFSSGEMARMYKPCLQDGDFEQDWHRALYPPWVLYGQGQAGIDLGQGKSASGRNNAWVAAPKGGVTGIEQRRIAVKPQTDYTLTAFCRGEANVQSATLLAKAAGFTGGRLGAILVPVGTDYTQVSLTFNTGEAQAVDIQLFYRGAQADTWLQIDDVSLQEVGPNP